MRFAIIGTGFVADYYMTTLTNHPELELVGCFDSNGDRLKQFCDYHNVRPYAAANDLLADDRVELVAVLTPPESHSEIANAALDAGKHVYCEKPLAMDFDDAVALVDKAHDRNLVLGGAPANALSDAFKLSKDIIDRGEIGDVKLVYVEMEDGPLFRENWQNWRSVSGAPWPGQHEFEIGCTLEHGGYGLSWLIGLFGPIHSIVGTSGVFFPDKGVKIPAGRMAPDFSTACLTFESGLVARLTCGLCAPKDRSLTVMGTQGTLTVADLWDSRSSIHVEDGVDKGSFWFRLNRRMESKLGRVLPFAFPKGRKVIYSQQSPVKLPAFPSKIDFSAGIAAVAACAKADRHQADLLAARTLHVTEAALALNRISDHDGQYRMKSMVEGQPKSAAPS